ncbi:MAG: hypothetical protein U1F49_14100 [Rubrivivax sp.]
MFQEPRITYEKSRRSRHSHYAEISFQAFPTETKARATMTAQAEELLLLDGRYEWLQSLPLQPYLDERGIDFRAAYWCSTALWRGYEAVWEMVDERLYLVGLLDGREHPIDPGLAFGDRPLPIAADWFSGRLDIGQGDSLMYFHMGWGATYSRELRLYLKQGRVVARRHYDQTRRLRRRFDRFVADNPDWLEILRAQARDSLGPIGGLTAAGIKALGRPELEAEGMPAPWPDALSSEDLAAIAERRLQHCKRAPQRIAAQGAPRPDAPS